MTIKQTLQKISYIYIIQRNFSSFPSAETVENETLPKFKSKSDFNFYWNCIMRADEDAMQKTRPWQRLELVPTYDRKKLRNSARGECLHKDYVFGKKIDKNELKNVLKSLDGQYTIETKNIVKPIEKCKRILIFEYPFAPMTLAKGFDPVYWREAYAQARIYLLGTEHGKHQSFLDVQNLIRATQPDIVFTEMCKTRAIEYGGLLTDEEIDKELGTFDKYLAEFIDRKQHGKKLDDFGWFQKWSLKREAKKEMDENKKKRDTEFRVAFEMAKKVPGCAGLVLGELANSQIEFLEAFNLQGNDPNDDEYQKEINENDAMCKRDRHMTKVMQTILHRCTMEKLCASHRIGVKFEPLVVVGIVGWAHLIGIERIWSKPEEIYLQK